MSKPPSSRAWRALLLAVVGVLVVVAGSCSSSGDDAGPGDLNIVTLPPPTDGATCTDPKGDISDSAEQVAGTLSEPAGVDILDANAKISDTDLTVTFTMAGPIADTREPLFYVSQGPSGLEASFELRIQPTTTPGTWGASLITWADQDGGVRESAPKVLSAPVTVDGSTLQVTVPLTDLPKIVTLVWQFGASATLPAAPGSTQSKTVLDDCNNMSDQTGPGTTVATTAPSGPSTTVPSGPLGTTLTSNGGVTVTVYAYQKPPTKLEPLTVPPDEGYEPAVIEAQICAGDADTTIQPGNFRLLTAQNELWGPWDVPQTATKPAFPEPGTLAAGDCRRGWITYELPTEAEITDVVFTPDSGANGTGTVLWSV